MMRFRFSWSAKCDVQRRAFLFCLRAHQSVCSMEGIRRGCNNCKTMKRKLSKQSTSGLLIYGYTVYNFYFVYVK